MYFVILLAFLAYLANLHKVNDLALIVSATLGELCQPDLLAVSINICQERRGEERGGQGGQLYLWCSIFSLFITALAFPA